jgi:hypothetical protein
VCSKAIGGYRDKGHGGQDFVGFQDGRLTHGTAKISHSTASRFEAGGFDGSGNSDYAASPMILKTAVGTQKSRSC